MPREDILPFSPTGLTDSLDITESGGGDIVRGNMAQLQNIVCDPTTRNLWICRPGIQPLSAASTQSIVCLKVVGDIVYGMRNSTLYPGYDEPFSYNIRTGGFYTITGVSSSNIPLSQATSGDWVPPTIEVIGIYVVVTHPGFVGGNYFGWFDTSVPSAPVWHAGNLDATGALVLPSRPAWVAQYAGRAYFGINPIVGQPSVVFTDPLALKCTTGTQVLTFGDNIPLVAGHGLPLSNQLGGVIQSLLVFKGVSNIYQVTGDAATNDLAINALNIPTGTRAPLAICNTPQGVSFLSPDGFRLIDFGARVSDVIGAGGLGITAPFINCLYPSRVVAACNASVMRVTVQSSTLSGSPFQEYWFDLNRRAWSGPHTIPMVAIDSYGDLFVGAPRADSGRLYESAVTPYYNTTSSEFGSTMSFVFQTALMDDPKAMAMMNMANLTIDMQLSSSQGQVFVSIMDETNSVLDTVPYQVTGTDSLWGVFVWGVDLWGGAPTELRPRRIMLSKPILYRRASVSVTGTGNDTFRIGGILIRRQILGYPQGAL